MKSLFKKRAFSYVLILLSFLIVQVLSYLDIINTYYMQVLMFAEINVIMTVSLNLINGFTGQFSMGHAAFMGIGAYISAIITALLFPTIIWAKPFQILIFLASVIAGGIIAGIVGLLIGLPTLKLKGDYFAIVTLAFGEVVKSIIRLIDYVGGPRGMINIPNYSNFATITIIMFVSIFLMRNYVNSKYGRACISIRENEVAAECMGINTMGYKVNSFAVSTFFAGVAGGLYAHLVMFIQPDQFSMIKSTDYLVFLYAGGMASISGSILGAVILTILPELLRVLSDWRYVIYPLVLIIIMLRKQNGIFGGREFPFLRIDRSQYFVPRRNWRSLPGKAGRGK